MPKLTTTEWRRINDLLDSMNDPEAEERFGLPERRERSVVIGTFNIRKLGKVSNRREVAWKFLASICDRFDLLAVQEVMDDLVGVRELMRHMLGTDFGLVVSDATGVFPGERGNPERLAFIFKWTRVRRTELASDITYDRSQVVKTLFRGRKAFEAAWKQHADDLKKWRKKVREAKAAGKKKPAKPQPELPEFLTFIRQPHCASFEVLAHEGEDPYEFLVVNAHLLFGTSSDERRMEFDALIEWLARRSKQSRRIYHENFLLMGDCNLEFETTGIIQDEIDTQLKRLNAEVLKSKRAAKVNFPLLTEHPIRGVLRTNARITKTYDQIAIFAHDERLPMSDANHDAGSFLDEYDYGVFNFMDLVSEALDGKFFEAQSEARRKTLIEKVQHEISDHMPAWFRLAIPGA